MDISTEQLRGFTIFFVVDDANFFILLKILFIFLYIEILLLLLLSKIFGLFSLTSFWILRLKWESRSIFILSKFNFFLFWWFFWVFIEFIFSKKDNSTPILLFSSILLLFLLLFEISKKSLFWFWFCILLCLVLVVLVVTLVLVSTKIPGINS